MKKIFGILFILGGHFVSAQVAMIKHKVIKGESISQIAQKYGVSASEIYDLNPDARTKITDNTILVIAVKKKKETIKKEVFKTINHTVIEGETLFSIAKKYQVTLSEIEKLNPTVVNGLKMDEVLKIPVKGELKSVSKNINAQQKILIEHTVVAKETKFGIAKQYGITVEELETKNPDIAQKELIIGQILLVKGNKSKEVIKSKIEEPNQTKKIETSKGATIAYTVKAQETLYSLTNQFGCSQEELILMNPDLKEGLKEGMILKIPAISKKREVKREIFDLTKNISAVTAKKMALLLPFNIAKLDQDTINSTKSRLKKDKFLNMTLDFYSGALIAIDSINKLGAKVDVTILDSDETRSSSNIPTLVNEYDLKTYDAVVGPFYQNNVEKLAAILETVPVISPLSKDYDKKFPNLYQATPLSEDIKRAMFDFMRSKNGNIIAIVDPKKQSAKQYIQENYKETKFVNVSDTGVLEVSHLKSLLVAGKTNYVVMETEKTNLILSITTNLLALQKQFDIKLVILGENEALDFEEIQMNRLTKLKMHYPSQYRVNTSKEYQNFENQYKRKNKINPNTFAIRGFDVTFDTLLRLIQEKPFADTANDNSTEQAESRFDYQSNPEGGFYNKGIYILYYDTDLTIKQAN
ncbi:Muramidase-2 precursor [Flavobacterium columnare]|uniref:LysM peptidoglycan-binding domain-containing protein n=2 Tax=Flavobacterium TaxID=237 RepID=A0ABW8PM69_9FLAO|nr:MULTISPECIES: LysM peptidoglycan-binding domain-containing protein [Flavobacterium]QYS89030.1 LysM peptidoglycan-binding domain-containing protein [Flavobacterium davisii]SPE78524.1 Muramidase-2 precursor [Flavobacterium columnare]